jgi:hypothetical protein
MYGVLNNLDHTRNETEDERDDWDRRVNGQVSRTGWSTDYYVLPDTAVELQDLIEHRSMNFSVGNIFKACYRLGRKDGTSTLYDLRKMKWFIEREIAVWENVDE